MFNHEKLIQESLKILSIASDGRSGNEECARAFISIFSELGFKTQLQPVHHSSEILSKKQFNLIGYSSDHLVDRSTRKGLLMVNPLDVTTGNVKFGATLQGDKIIAPGAAQGKIDFLCRILAATELLERRHKVPLYLVGTAASHFGMTGAKFLIESLMVNPKEVISFAPTGLKVCNQAAGHLGFSVEIESASRDRDSRGYNRCVILESFGLSVDFAASENAINAYELLMDLLMEASSNGFDFQWSTLETSGAEGANPDYAQAQIFLTSFQYEDFKQFMRGKLGEEGRSQFFKVNFVGVTETAVSFLSPTLIEVILELDYEWKSLVSSSTGSMGMLTQILNQNGKTGLRFEVRHPVNIPFSDIENQWKEKIHGLFSKHREFNFLLQKERFVPALVFNEKEKPTVDSSELVTHYASDAGWFSKYKFPVSVVGLGNMDQFIKGPNEFVLVRQIEDAIRFYREVILSHCL